MQDQFPRPNIFRSELGPLDNIRNVEPFDVVNPPATLTDEMMVVFGVTFIAGGVTHECYFPHQTRVNQGMQAVVNRCPRSPRVTRIDAPEDLVGGAMRRMPPEIFEENVPLRSTPQAACTESTNDSVAVGSHSGLRILLIRDYVKPHERHYQKQP
jgi:hypothetical protein